MSGEYVDLQPSALEFDVLTVTPSLTALDTGYKLGLAHYVASGDNASSEKLGTGYYDNGKFYPVSETHRVAKKVALSQEVSLEIKLKDGLTTQNGLSKSEYLGQLYEQDVALKVTFSTPEKSSGEIDNRARVFATIASEDDPIGNTVTVTASLSLRTLIARSGSEGAYSYDYAYEGGEGNQPKKHLTAACKFYIYGGDVGAESATTANDGTTNVTAARIDYSVVKA